MTAAALLKDLTWSAYVWPKGALGNRVQGTVIGGLETWRVRRAWDRAGRVLLVHTPGKVGSMAMVAALEASRRPDDAIFHTHRMNPDYVLGVAEERATLAPRRTWYTTDFLGAQLRRAHDKEVVVLSAVRDPVERSLSAFLQNVERFNESGRPITAMSKVNIDDLTRVFIERLDHRTITRWVEMELNAMFGVDVFSTPFDHTRGYQLLSHDRLRLGVIRHDRFGDALEPFIDELTGLRSPSVGRVNDSSAKAYAEVHRLMRASMRLPARLLADVYGTPYARHFFTESERDAAARRWLGPVAAS